jgi:hypothetical protein
MTSIMVFIAWNLHQHPYLMLRFSCNNEIMLIIVKNSITNTDHPYELNGKYVIYIM